MAEKQTSVTSNATRSFTVNTLLLTVNQIAHIVNQLIYSGCNIKSISRKLFYKHKEWPHYLKKGKKNIKERKGQHSYLTIDQKHSIRYALKESNMKN